MTHIPKSLHVEDFENESLDFTILYYWTYRDGSQDSELREYKTDISVLENYFNSIEWNEELPFDEFWANASYPSKLDFLYMLLADSKTGIIVELIQAFIAESSPLSKAS